MAGHKKSLRDEYTLNSEIAALWPDVSGNSINGLDQADPARPRPVFWREDGSTPHGPVMFYFYERYKDNANIAAARKYRQRTAVEPDSDVAPEAEHRLPDDWTASIKAAALEMGADDVCICLYDPEWSFADRPVPQGKWAIVMAFEHAYDNLSAAPDDATYIEIMRQYGRAGLSAKKLANWIKDRGHFAAPKTGPMTEDVLMIPAAIQAGLGELGKHGSMLHKKFGANFRLSMVLTDVPLEADEPEIFGGDLFCQNCQICTNACPPAAIAPEKQLVRGERKWYVDFDKCIPYFVDYQTCGICLAVCPWSRPGLAEKLLLKMARRMAQPSSG